MAASIRSLVNAALPLTGVSRADLRAGDVVTLEAADTSNTTYAWNITYKPAGSTATLSGDPTAANPGTFTVDLEGSYQVRLITDLGLATESTQFVRLRFLTILGDLRLVSAGEQTGAGISVPVDLSSTGWADDQNYNISTLLSLIQPIVQTGRVYYVDQNNGTEGYADFDTLQAAINAAVANSPSASNPWVILARPGLYTEDVVFAPHVHVAAWPGNAAGAEENRIVVIRPTTPGVALDAAVTGGGDRLVLANLTMEAVSSGTNATLTKTGAGELVVFNCTIIQNGTGASQGGAFEVTAGTAHVIGSRIQMSSGAPADRPAVTQEGASTTLKIYDSVLVGPSGLITNTAFAAGVTTEVVESRISSSGGVGSYSVISDSESLLLEYTRIEGTESQPVRIHPSASVTAQNVAATIRWTSINGEIVFDTTNVGGTSTLNVGSSEYTDLTYPGTAPTVTATTISTSLFYDNTATGMSAENVQDAIDEVHVIASAITTLDEAYDGGVAASGSGRTIIADQGAVQIVDASSPSDPPPPANTNGNLEVVGSVSVGALTTPEILVDPNPYGNGPLVSLGAAVTANNAPFGSSALIKANSTGNPLYRNYNLRLFTESTEGGGALGRVIIRGGDGLSNGGSTPDASSVYVHAGSGLDAAAGEAGSIYLTPGTSVFGSTGNVILVRPEAATAATVTAAGAFVGGVTGTIRFATNVGAIEVAIDAADNLAATLTAFNNTGHVTAVDSGGGVIQLTTVATGPNAEIFYLNDTVSGSLDTALGVFDGQSQVDGTWPEFIEISASADQEISFGASGATGPMLYNADTGKLTVPGLIDPTGVIFVEAVEPATAASEGALWVSDGSGGLIAGDLYYRPNGGSIVAISTPAGDAAWGFPVLSESQLDDTNDALSQAIAFFLQEQPTSGDTITIDDGVGGDRTYGFGSGGDVTVTIGGDIDTTLANLASDITSDGSGLWDAVLETTLSSINDGTGSVTAGLVVVIYRANQSAASFDDRIYGSFTTGVPLYVNYNLEVTYASATTAALPGSDPAQKEFGPGNDTPTQGESHYVMATNAFFLWDADSGVWSSGGFTTAGTGLSSSGGTINANAADASITMNADDFAVNLEASGAGTGGLTLTGSGLAVLLESAGAGTGGLEKNSNGLAVLLESAGAGTGGLAQTASGLAVLLEGAGAGTGGLEQTASGLAVLLEGAGAGTGGLAQTASGLAVDVGTGLELTASGVGIADDATTVAKLGISFREEIFADSDFTYTTESAVTLANTPVTGAKVDGFVECYRNGVADMTNTGATTPTTTDEFQVTASPDELVIGGDITTSTNEYRVRYISSDLT